MIIHPFANPVREFADQQLQALQYLAVSFDEVGEAFEVVEAKVFGVEEMVVELLDRFVFFIFT